jgi:hypothetical protein
MKQVVNHWTVAFSKEGVDNKTHGRKCEWWRMMEKSNKTRRRNGSNRNPCITVNSKSNCSGNNPVHKKVTHSIDIVQVSSIEIGY